MSIATDIQFSGDFKVLDNLLSFDYALNVPKNAFFARNNFEEVAHSNSKVYHPKYDKLVKGTSSLFLMKGSTKISAIFDEELGIDMEMVSQYSQYITNDTDIPYEISLENNALIYKFNDQYSFENWQEPPSVWVPDIDNTYLELTSDNNNIICCLRLEDPENWTPQLINIKANDTFNISKEGSKCYLAFGGSVNSLEAFKLYELTSDNLEATANEDVVVFRIFKND